jgi:hypothetical protein
VAPPQPSGRGPAERSRYATALALDPTNPTTAYLGFGVFSPFFRRSTPTTPARASTPSPIVNVARLHERARRRPSDPATVWAAIGDRPRRSRDAAGDFDDLGGGLRNSASTERRLDD